MRRLFLILCFTEIDLKNVECRSYCRFHLGYDSGLYQEKEKVCFCLDKIGQERLEEKKLTLPKKLNKTFVSDNYEYNPADIPQSEPEIKIEIPYKLPWE